MEQGPVELDMPASATLAQDLYQHVVKKLWKLLDSGNLAQILVNNVSTPFESGVYLGTSDGAGRTRRLRASVYVVLVANLQW